MALRDTIRVRVTQNTKDFLKAIQEEYGYSTDSEVIRLAIDNLKLTIDTGFFTKEAVMKDSYGTEIKRLHHFLEVVRHEREIEALKKKEIEELKKKK